MTELEELLSSGKISIYECAALSSDVYYNSSDTNKPSLPPGWVRFKESGYNANGYFGVCYLKEIGNELFMVFAHRGTVISNPRSLVNALQVGLETIPSQITTASLFVKSVQESLIKIPKFNREGRGYMLHTGHSLGAILADMLVVEYPPFSITFENPGSRKIIFDYESERMKRAKSIDPTVIIDPIEFQEGMNAIMQDCMVTYQVDVNLINTCNE